MRTRNIILSAVMLFASLTAWGAPAVVGKPAPVCADSVMRSTPPNEMAGMMQRRMVQSAYPVTVTMRGNAVCVRSKYNQLLPVYTQNGVFYAAFRLTKGTNWLSGLPRGTYIINNQRITVS